MTCIKKSKKNTLNMQLLKRLFISFYLVKYLLVSIELDRAETIIDKT